MVGKTVENDEVLARRNVGIAMVVERANDGHAGLQSKTCVLRSCQSLSIQADAHGGIGNFLISKSPFYQ